MSVKKKLLAILIFSALLCACCMFFFISEGRRFCGIRLLDSDEYRELLANRENCGKDMAIKELLRFEGQSLPYDADSNTFYISQNPDEKKFKGFFSSNNPAYKLCMEKDDYAADKKQAVLNGHSFKIALYDDKGYAEANLTYTFLPIVDLDSRDLENDESRIAIWDPYNKSFSQITKYAFEGTAAENENGTYTLHFFDKDKVNLNASILNFKENHTFKLYKNSENSLLKEAFSYDLWNETNDIPELSKDFDFCEVVENDVYRGLYIISSKTNNHRVGDDKAQITEINNNETGEVSVPFMEKECDNIISYLTFLQLTGAYSNADNDVLIIEGLKNRNYIVPDRIKYSFGEYPFRMTYLSDMGADTDLRKTAFGINYFVGDAASLFTNDWKNKRASVFSDDNLEKVYSKRLDELIASGLAARSSLTVNADDTTLLANHCAYLDEQYLGVKTGVIDRENKRGTFPDIFVAINDNARQNIKLFIKNEEAYIFLPSYADVSLAKINYDENCFDVFADGEEVKSGENFHKLKDGANLNIKIKGDEGIVTDEAMLNLHIMQSDNLPAIYIDTVSGTMDYLDEDKIHREPGYITCITSDGEMDYEGNLKNLHGRGESSWQIRPKGYRLNLNEYADILNMGESTAYNLVSNGFDFTRIRNALSYTLCEDMNFNSVREYRFADVYFNGEYTGNYILCETITQTADRVGIPKGSVIFERMEKERIPEDAVYFVTNETHYYVITNPEEVSDDTIKFAQKRMQLIENMARECDAKEAYDEFSGYVDIDSFAKQYLVTMITNERDSNKLSTFYYFSPEDQKLYAGPEWDFDRGFGAVAHDVDISSRNRLNEFMSSFTEFMFQSDYCFNDLRRVYNENLSAFGKLSGNVYTFEDNIKNSLDMTVVLYGRPQTGLTYFEDRQANYDYVKNAIDGKLGFLSEYFADPTEFHKVFFGGYVYFAKDGEPVEADAFKVLKEILDVEEAIYPDGTPFDMDTPITEDTILHLR